MNTNESISWNELLRILDFFFSGQCMPSTRYLFGDQCMSSRIYYLLDPLSYFYPSNGNRNSQTRTDLRRLKDQILEHQTALIHTYMHITSKVEEIKLWVIFLSLAAAEGDKLQVSHWNQSVTFLIFCLMHETFLSL